MTYFGIFIGGLLVSNLVFARFLGICPFLGVSKKLETAAGMSMAVVFVMTLASVITWLFHTFVLVPLDLEFLRTVAFILVVASLVQFVEMVVMKVSPSLYQALGIFLPLITTNCAVLGAAIININSGYSFPEAVVGGIAAGAGWSLAILLFAGIRERLDISDVPESLKGFPIALISTGLMAMAFVGFQGLFQELLR